MGIEFTHGEGDPPAPARGTRAVTDKFQQTIEAITTEGTWVRVPCREADATIRQKLRDALYARARRANRKLGRFGLRLCVYTAEDRKSFILKASVAAPEVGPPDAHEHAPEPDPIERRVKAAEVKYRQSKVTGGDLPSAGRTRLPRSEAEAEKRQERRRSA